MTEQELNDALTALEDDFSRGRFGPLGLSARACALGQEFERSKPERLHARIRREHSDAVRSLIRASSHWTEAERAKAGVFEFGVARWAVNAARYTLEEAYGSDVVGEALRGTLEGE
jgi:hypothetical protein